MRTQKRRVKRIENNTDERKREIDREREREREEKDIAKEICYDLVRQSD